VHRLTIDEAELKPENGIRIGRWTQYTGLGDRPFGAMWFEVPAGGRSVIDGHPEVELAVVLSGEATFTVEGRDVNVSCGTAVLLQPYENHVVHAKDDPVQVLSLYWMPVDNPQPGGTSDAG
jgi:quercetin dioxygenase-like cupin family protein